MPYQLKSLYASLPQVERGVAKVIGGDPKGNNFLYTNGKSVIIRNIENPAISDVYTEHSHQVLVAKYAPSGFYIASGGQTCSQSNRHYCCKKLSDSCSVTHLDFVGEGHVSGKLRIWDSTQKEHILKYEYQPFGGKIKDISWSEDSKRIAIVGEGREKYGAVILWDSGSSVGEIAGHTKTINSVDIRPSRPYRLVTASDDNCGAFYHGPPFKFQFTLMDHTRFVNCIRFSPDGARFATAGADGQIFVYDGTSGQKICALGGDKAHDGGIYAISWSADSSQLISASGDRTVRLWDVATSTATTTFSMGPDVSDQQLGCLWQGSHMLSISLSGHINYLDANNPSKPIRVIKGHSKPVQSLALNIPKDKDGQATIYTGSIDGHINHWDAESGINDGFAGKGHTNQVSHMAVDESNSLVSCSMDDTLRFTSLNSKEYSAQDTLKLNEQPKSVAVGPGGCTVVICIGQILLLKDRKKAFVIEAPGFGPEAVSIHPSNGIVAVGGVDGKVHMYDIDGNTLKKHATVSALQAHGPVTDVAFSPNGAFLAVCDSNKVVSVFNTVDDYKEHGTFYGHHAKVTCLAWSPDCQHFATGGMDMMVYVWTVEDPNNRIRIPDSHRMHHVSGIAWLDTHTLVTTSHDATVRQWTITY